MTSPTQPTADAITPEMRFAARQTGDVANQMSSPELDAVYTAMQAARPIAPVQDDDAEWLLSLGPVWAHPSDRALALRAAPLFGVASLRASIDLRGASSRWLRLCNRSAGMDRLREHQNR
jgi:hypothetical protein